MVTVTTAAEKLEEVEGVYQFPSPLWVFINSPLLFASLLAPLYCPILDPTVPTLFLHHIPLLLNQLGGLVWVR